MFCLYNSDFQAGDAHFSWKLFFFSFLFNSILVVCGFFLLCIVSYDNILFLFDSNAKRIVPNKWNQHQKNDVNFDISLLCFFFWDSVCIKCCHMCVIEWAQQLARALFHSLKNFIWTVVCWRRVSSAVCAYNLCEYWVVSEIGFYFHTRIYWFNMVYSTQGLALVKFHIFSRNVNGNAKCCVCRTELSWTEEATGN